MDENRIAGTAKNLSGKAEESLGRAAGDAKTQAKGIVDQVSGAAQDAYGQARDAAADMAQAATSAARDTASSFEKTVRNTIENQPYTAVGIALALGWWLGRISLVPISRCRVRAKSAATLQGISPWIRRVTRD
jgi:uncharacterized protein YjbJ (UPF0337 family)